MALNLLVEQVEKRCNTERIAAIGLLALRDYQNPQAVRSTQLPNTGGKKKSTSQNHKRYVFYAILNKVR